jgi:hypothetical protein
MFYSGKRKTARFAAARVPAPPCLLSHARPLDAIPPVRDTRPPDEHKRALARACSCLSSARRTFVTSMLTTVRQVNADKIAVRP